MRVRRKMIGGQVRYEIAEVFDHLGEVEYRSIVPLGGDADPEEALRKRQASLIDIIRTLRRLQPLQGANPAIQRKCDTLKSRLKSEQERIGLLMSAIERLDDGEFGGDEEPATDG
jgi:hypothetical protein